MRLHMKALRAVIVLVLVLALPAPVLAADFQTGLQAYERGDYARALEEIRPLANLGDAEAQVLLAIMYNSGGGVTKDYALAAKWFEAAAVQGSADAQHNLALMYEQGTGVPQDYVQAHMWYKLAAARYPARASRDLALRMLDRVEAQMTPEQINEAQHLAREWKPK